MNLVQELLPNMRRVLAVDRDLHDLALVWTVIETSAAIGCPDEAESILPTLSQTRERFADLQTRLVAQLGQESLAALGDELAATAQCSIDILVRNLFERTADVGFLATDDVLRAHCAATAAERAASQPALLRRLGEYRCKYSVYDDIVVLGTGGDVLARLDTGSELSRSHDPVLAQALSRSGFVERYGPSDLGPAAAPGQPALLYAHRIESAQGRSLGVLVLRFRMADEMQRIFDSVARARQALAVLLIDADNRVRFSNDESFVAVGTLLRPGAPGELALQYFGGQEVLSLMSPARGYQGYAGPGWRAVALLPLALAFRPRDEVAAMREGVALDNDELRRIQAEVDGINRNLRRVVWNGRLLADARGGGRGQLKAVLQQVTEAGSRMRERAGLAVLDLYRTALGRAQQQSAELARLAADIMDRNLYERANDCRWWALSPVLQDVLSQGADAQGAERLNRVLATINGLYTVYARLVAFDAGGRIRGVSNDDVQAPLLGTVIAPELLAATLALSDSQHYAVSPFAPTALSGGVPTYVYLAAVRGAAGGKPVGGIAIVFNAEREFRAMLDDVLDGRAGIAAFIDGAGCVVASTDPAHAKGQPLPLRLGEAIIEHDDAHYAVATAAAAGYREFKLDDGYQNHVRAVVALRLGALERRRAALVDQAVRALPHTSRRQVREFALFQVGAARYAVPVASVLEARPTAGMVRVTHAGPGVIGLLEVAHGGAAQVLQVVCARRLFGVDYPARTTDGTVLVMGDTAAPGRALYGLRVDDVISVLDVDALHVQAAPNGLRCSAPWLHSMVRLMSVGPPATEALAQLLDPDALAHAALPGRGAAAPETPRALAASVV
jgi:chemotaxis signal transduction protein